MSGLKTSCLGLKESWEHPGGCAGAHEVWESPHSWQCAPSPFPTLVWLCKCGKVSLVTSLGCYLGTWGWERFPFLADPSLAGVNEAGMQSCMEILARSLFLAKIHFPLP